MCAVWIRNYDILPRNPRQKAVVTVKKTYELLEEIPSNISAVLNDCTVTSVDVERPYSE
jgi:predicted CoA-binding protein